MSKFYKGPRKSLSSKLIIGYANWNQCDEKIVSAVKDGVNVVIWFAINLSTDSSGDPVISNGPDWNCVAQKVATIRELPGCEDTVHLISVGGWNAPHPDLSKPVQEVYNHWDWWNRKIIARPDIGFFGFDGLDWDIEGHDDVQHENNHFAVECLDFIGQFSQLAKRDGYIVSMAPAESYFDPLLSPQFDRSLRHEYEEWRSYLSDPFPYHGRNVYTYIFARYGRVSVSITPISDGEVNEYQQEVDTFDFVTVQLYEGYSHFQHRLVHSKIDPATALVDFCRTITSDWFIDFTSDPSINFPFVAYNMKLPSDKLVVGLANGWAGDGKFALVLPQDVQRAYETLSADTCLGSDAFPNNSHQPRGFAFWNILDEGCGSIYMAAGLNTFLHTRTIS